MAALSAPRRSAVASVAAPVAAPRSRAGTASSRSSAGPPIPSMVEDRHTGSRYIRGAFLGKVCCCCLRRAKQERLPWEKGEGMALRLWSPQLALIQDSIPPRCGSLTLSLFLPLALLPSFCMRASLPPRCGLLTLSLSPSSTPSFFLYVCVSPPLSVNRLFVFPSVFFFASFFCCSYWLTYFLPVFSSSFFPFPSGFSKQGGFAQCYKLTDVQTRMIYAGKIVAKASLTQHRAKEKVRTLVLRSSYTSFNATCTRVSANSRSVFFWCSPGVHLADGTTCFPATNGGHCMRFILSLFLPLLM